ncbi:response regulator transcription factor [Lentzea sp. NPDC051213]|uniref:response regulator transcription factor n=1 Tax=Lentzea sp. NPDC051213 TaxID=3364126 RepID=UPI0037AFBC71
MQILVRSTDHISKAGVMRQLEECADMDVLDDAVEPDVVVVVTDRLSQHVLAALRRCAAEHSTPVVLVADEVAEPDLAVAVQHHVVAVLPRVAATTDQLAQTVRIAAAGGGVLSPAQVGELLKRVKQLQREAIAPLGVNRSGLTAREVDVLRLMADGLGVGEIADSLCYSERTVKYVIQGVMSRLNLRNRLHAVVYAMRAGLI